MPQLVSALSELTNLYSSMQIAARNFYLHVNTCKGPNSAGAKLSYPALDRS